MHRNVVPGEYAKLPLCSLSCQHAMQQKESVRRRESGFRVGGCVCLKCQEGCWLLYQRRPERERVMKECIKGRGFNQKCPMCYSTQGARRMDYNKKEIEIHKQNTCTQSLLFKAQDNTCR